MLYSKGHGRPAHSSAGTGAMQPQYSRTFRYYDRDLPLVTHDAGVVTLLDRLGDEMANPQTPPPGANSALPTFFTYLGQFVDHDLSAGTDFAAGAGGGGLAPMPRDEVEHTIGNQNTARLDLDSLYGDVILETEFDEIFARALRSTRHPGKMRIAFPEFIGAGDNVQIPPKPADRAGDLLRLGEVLGDELEPDVLLALPRPLQELFFFLDGENPPRPNRARAIIGDARNDENLFVAQVHLALLRLHNVIVDACTDPSVQAGGSDALFAWAKARTRRIYQWLIVNEFLREVCDPGIYDAVLTDEARLYRWFVQETGGPAANGRLPLPLEFSVAAYRFGHSMARESYDWNAFFPDGAGTLGLLFQFTGGVQTPMAGLSDHRVPSNWVIDWSFHERADPANPFRATRAIDTDLSIELATLPLKANEADNGGSRNLATLNLRKGHLLNLPSAQSLIDAFNARGGYGIVPLSPAEIASGHTGSVVAGTVLERETPLWFYVLKEAEIRQNGQRLGQLGSLIVASTILGLVIEDGDSYWHLPGSDGGKWHPADDVRPSGIAVTSFADLLRAALLL